MERQRGNGIGEDGERIAGNISMVRKTRGIDLRYLSAATREAGRYMSPSALSKLENLDRKIDVDDLFVLADALAVSVDALLGLSDHEVAVRVPLAKR
ncbi:helix-turn-helix transcriptional regulator [Curtobacterium sp. MCSS17_015]|uniref:helix-turn-helix domain-containing protein n=1 Tax=Curtobacterium sp. MCSS17_015 TaxID=2175666 RepID=UPI000DA77525|nr:helix-turn-helix transcriptional regulator [Curtobacterium sp. MCSS17_015]WIB25822.1 helix-turn-helix transcriptional regulator [Curtobacterium sp. MCSS17_015]